MIGAFTWAWLRMPITLRGFSGSREKKFDLRPMEPFSEPPTERLFYPPTFSPRLFSGSLVIPSNNVVSPCLLFLLHLPAVEKLIECHRNGYESEMFFFTMVPHSSCRWFFLLRNVRVVFNLLYDILSIVSSWWQCLRSWEVVVVAIIVLLSGFVIQSD